MSGDTYQALVSVLEFGARGDGNTNDTASIQSAIDYANQIGAAVFFPAAMYRVSQIVLRQGTILQGVSSGTYPDNNSISGASVLARLANTNKHLVLAPDGSNYCRIFDLAIDGNKNNNTSGYGLCVADGAVRAGVADHRRALLLPHQSRLERLPGQEPAREQRAEQRLQLLAQGRRHHRRRVGQHDRRQHHRQQRAGFGICLGTTATQNWPASSPNFAANIAHVSNNDIYGNLVGIALANASSGCMIAGNGIDRNKYQGITVYSGASYALVTNTFHSNGTA